jgi:hypothetical protein
MVDLSDKSIENIKKQSDKYILEASVQMDKIHDMGNDYILGDKTNLSDMDEEYKKMKNALKKLKELKKSVE